ncbi:hypothetical protein ACFVT5_15945 [Streptomyces sp. NPDC058001]|uniref:hypothetical protein n=1 Tax=Streptomyces sp. NPDC058001 TaxID=3346300 RepID=UPI0036EAC85F
MAHTIEELIEKQQVANEAHAKVLALRDTYDAPTQGSGWTQTQTATYETAWRAWRDLARDVQSAVTEFARDQGMSRSDVEADVKARAQPPAPDKEAPGSPGEA